MVNDAATSLKVNFAQILDVEPAPISCMSLNERDQKLQLALFRGGNVGAIEIWNVSHQPYLVKVILDLETIEGKPSVESIIWVKNRLFSCGLHGFVLEHDINSGRVKNKNVATSGPVWCLAANTNDSLIAAGTEDGFINIFEVDDNSLTYLKVLDRQDGRVLCLQWSPCGRYIATGSIDSIRLWNVEKGHAVQRLVTGRTKNKETIVWSVLMLEDWTIVSGDSRGMISFWDGRIGVLKFKVQTHKADVLTLRLSKDKTCMYAAGVDPIVIMLTKVGNSDKWVKSNPRNMHLNDVLCLETYGNRLFSGGVDSELCVSSFPPKIVVKYPPFLKNPHVVSSLCGKRILTKQSRSIAIWDLPTEESKLTKVLNLGTKMQESVFSVCLSPTGTVFGYSTGKALRFFKLDKSTEESKMPTLTKLNFIDSLAEEEEETKSSLFDIPIHLQFLQEDKVALVAANGKSISFVKIDIQLCTATRVKKVDIELSSNYGLGVSIISVSNNGKYICLVCDENVHVYAIMDNFEIKKCSAIPCHTAQPTAIVFHPMQPFVLITYSDHLIQLFDYKEGRIILYQRIKKKIDDMYPYIGAMWSPNGRSAILYQVDGLQLLEMDSEDVPKKKTKRDDKHEDKYIFTVKSSTKHKYIAFAGYYNDGQEIVAIEVNPNGLLEKLPPSFVKKRFGG